VSLLRFFGFETSDATYNPPETETVRRICKVLDQLAPDRARYVAAFAYLLHRVAGADLNISPEETAAIERILAEQAGLTPELGRLVLEIAREQKLRSGGTEDFLVTREFNRLATREQKLALLHCLFLVGSSDDSVSVVEDNEIRQIASEICLDHPDFIAVRSAFRDHLAVLKNHRR
jgi:uncharacterized tellurite resistance protein B-like protein